MLRDIGIIEYKKFPLNENKNKIAFYFITFFTCIFILRLQSRTYINGECNAKIFTLLKVPTRLCFSFLFGIRKQFHLMDLIKTMRWGFTGTVKVYDHNNPILTYRSISAEIGVVSSVVLYVHFTLLNFFNKCLKQSLPLTLKCSFVVFHRYFFVK